MTRRRLQSVLFPQRYVAISTRTRPALSPYPSDSKQRLTDGALNSTVSMEAPPRNARTGCRRPIPLCTSRYGRPVCLSIPLCTPNGAQQSESSLMQSSFSLYRSARSRYGKPLRRGPGARRQGREEEGGPGREGRQEGSRQESQQRRDNQAG